MGFATRDEPSIPLGSIALALGGGAALGWAHIGVLRVLEEEGIAVGAVAGTSIGALAGLCLAAGKLDVLEEIALGATRGRVLSYLDPCFGRGAFLGGKRIARELEGHFAGMTFADLAMPLAMVAADLDTAEEVRLTSGPVIDAVQASMALPALFQPVVRDGRTLIDGGMVAALPVGAARALAPGLPLVAIDLLGDFAGHVAGVTGGGRARSAIATARSAFLMMMAAQTRQTIALVPPALTLALPVGGYGTGAFTAARPLIAIGRTAAEKALPQIRAIVSARKLSI